jgi:hypothetical protein
VWAMRGDVSLSCLLLCFPIDEISRQQINCLNSRTLSAMAHGLWLLAERLYSCRRIEQISYKSLRSISSDII